MLDITQLENEQVGLKKERESEQVPSKRKIMNSGCLLIFPFLAREHQLS